MKTLQAGFAIGITANFTNTQTDAELSLQEFGLISYARREWFNEMKEKYGVELENLVSEKRKEKKTAFHPYFFSC